MYTSDRLENLYYHVCIIGANSIFPLYSIIIRHKSIILTIRVNLYTYITHDIHRHSDYNMCTR